MHQRAAGLHWITVKQCKVSGWEDLTAITHHLDVKRKTPKEKKIITGSALLRWTMSSRIGQRTEIKIVGFVVGASGWKILRNEEHVWVKVKISRGILERWGKKVAKKSKIARRIEQIDDQGKFAVEQTKYWKIIDQLAKVQKIRQWKRINVGIKVKYAE